MTSKPTSTAEAIKQQRPFRTANQEATVALLITTEAIRRRFSTFLAHETKDQITLQQYNVLRILRGAGTDGLPTLTVAERMMEKTPGITGMIDRLQKKGLVEREHCPHDRRQVTCRISPAGSKLLAKLDKPIDNLDDTVLGCLKEPEVRQLITLLDRIRNHNT